MKKKVIYIILAVVMILAILTVTKQLPPPSEEESTGTIGKVDKYRKVQMTENDIILRSEFVKDTSALAQSIQGLLLFNAFAKDYAGQIKNWTDDLEKNGSSLKSLQTVKDYYSFLDNNIPAVENTIALLADFYAGDTTEMSIDIEKKLSDFYSFASQLFLKDSTISRLIPELEKKISKDLALKDKKDEEVKRLKEIHDQMLVKTMQVALIAGDKKAIDAALSGILYNSSNLQSMGLSSKADLQNIKLGAIFNSEKLGLFSQSGLNPAVCSQVELGPIVWAQDNLGPSAAAAHEKLGSAMAQEKLGPAMAQEKLGPLAQEKLGALAQEKLGAIMAQEKLGSAMAQEKLSAIMSHGDLGPLLTYATVTFGNAILSNTSSFGNITLGPALFNSGALHNYIQSSIGAGLNSKLESSTLMNLDKLGSF